MATQFALMTVIGTALLFLGAYSALAPSPVKGRLARFTDRVRTLEELELEQPFAERVIRPAFMRVSRWLARFRFKKDEPGSEQRMGRIARKLLLAGNPGDLSADDFIGIVVLGVLGAAALMFVLSMTLLALDLGSALLMVLIGVMLGYLIPSLWLEMKIKGRGREISRALPDAIDLLVVSVQAGISFDIAMQRLTDKADNALLAEFRRVLAEMQVGRSRQDALRDMTDRTDVPDVKNFVAAIIQADQLGVSISRVIAVQAEQIRTIRRQRAEEQAAQAALKMLFPMIFLIFPSLFVVILGPAIPKIFTSGAF